VANRAAAVEARLGAAQADLDDIKARIAQLDQTKTVATKGHRAEIAAPLSARGQSRYGSKRAKLFA
jgi:hypothetical protein